MGYVNIDDEVVKFDADKVSGDNLDEKKENVKEIVEPANEELAKNGSIRRVTALAFDPELEEGQAILQETSDGVLLILPDLEGTDRELKTDDISFKIVKAEEEDIVVREMVVEAAVSTLPDIASAFAVRDVVVPRDIEERHLEVRDDRVEFVPLSIEFFGVLGAPFDEIADT